MASPPEPPSPELRTLALRYGTLESTASALFRDWEATGVPDRPWRQDYFVWTVGAILVDTGFSDAAGARRGRTLLHPVEALLREAGLDPETVEDVVLSHAHYDHIGNLGLFPRARFTLAREEFEAAAQALKVGIDPEGPLERSDLESLMALERSGRVCLFDGRFEIAPGIELVTIGGHTPGQLAVVVRGSSGTLVLAADSVHFYAELESGIPYAIADDPAGLLRGYETVRTLAAGNDAAIVPGHDPLVRDRFPPATTPFTTVLLP